MTETDTEFLDRMAGWKDGTRCSEKSWMRLIALARRAVKLQAALTQAHALYGEQNDKG